MNSTSFLLRPSLARTVHFIRIIQAKNIRPLLLCSLCSGDFRKPQQLTRIEPRQETWTKVTTDGGVYYWNEVSFRKLASIWSWDNQNVKATNETTAIGETPQQYRNQQVLNIVELNDSKFLICTL